MTMSLDHEAIIQKSNIESFNINLWRKALDKAAAQTTAITNIGINVITPFGFEVFQDKRFLNKPLRRFYCYFGSLAAIADPSKIRVIENEFVNSLRDVLEVEWRQMAEEIISYKTQTGFIPSVSDDISYENIAKVVSVNYIPTNDILLSYAKYVVCSVDGISKGTQPEVLKFHANQVARNRVFQMYLMNEEIFKDIMPGFSNDEENMRQKLFKQDNRIDYFIRPELSPPASQEEKEILIHLIQKRLGIMREALLGNVNTDRIVLSLPAFHGKATVSIELSRVLWQKALNLIQSSYIDFGY